MEKLLDLGCLLSSEDHQALLGPMAHCLIPCYEREHTNVLESLLGTKNLFTKDLYLWLEAIKLVMSDCALAFNSQNPLLQKPLYGPDIHANIKTITPLHHLLKSTVPQFKPNMGAVSSSHIWEHVVCILRYMLTNRIQWGKKVQLVLTASFKDHASDMLDLVVTKADYYIRHKSSLLGIPYFWIYALESLSSEKRDFHGLLKETHINGKQFFYDYNHTLGIPYLQKQARFLVQIDNSKKASDKETYSEAMRKELYQYALINRKESSFSHVCNHTTYGKLWSISIILRAKQQLKT